MKPKHEIQAETRTWRIGKTEQKKKKEEEEANKPIQAAIWMRKQWWLSTARRLAADGDGGSVLIASHLLTLSQLSLGVSLPLMRFNLWKFGDLKFAWVARVFYFRFNGKAHELLLFFWYKSSWIINCAFFSKYIYAHPLFGLFRHIYKF